MPENCHPQLAPFIPLAGMLKEAHGPDCEIMPRDLTDECAGITASADGHLPGRTKDSSISGFARFLTASPETREPCYIADCPAEAGGVRFVRPGVLPVRGEGRAPAGMLCVNRDTAEARLLPDEAAFLTAVRPLPFEGALTEHSGARVDGASFTAEASRRAGSPPEYPTGAQRRRRIAFPGGPGFFRLEGSTGRLAEETRKSRRNLRVCLRAARRAPAREKESAGQ